MLKNSYKTPIFTKLTLAFCAVTTLFSVIVVNKMQKLEEEIENLSTYAVYYIVESDCQIENPTESFLEDPEYYRITHQEAQFPHVMTEEENLLAHVSRICQHYSISEQIVCNLIQTESDWNPNAISSDGNHVGLMQLSVKYQTARAKRLGVQDLFDPYGNILVGIDYLAYTLNETGGDMAWALMIYNEGYQSAYAKHCSGVISNYAKKIMDI